MDEQAANVTSRRGGAGQALCLLDAQCGGVRSRETRARLAEVALLGGLCTGQTLSAMTPTKNNINCNFWNYITDPTSCRVRNYNQRLSQHFVPSCVIPPSPRPVFEKCRFDECRQNKIIPYMHPIIHSRAGIGACEGQCGGGGRDVSAPRRHAKPPLRRRGGAALALTKECIALPTVHQCLSGKRSTRL